MIERIVTPLGRRIDESSPLVDARLKDGSRRITAITEVAGMEGEVITMQDLFTFDYSAGRDEQGRFKGTLISTGLRPKFSQELHDQGIEFAPDLFVRGA